jgi:hypothetical protein
LYLNLNKNNSQLIDYNKINKNELNKQLNTQLEKFKKYEELYKNVNTYDEQSIGYDDYIYYSICFNISSNPLSPR